MGNKEKGNKRIEKILLIILAVVVGIYVYVIYKHGGFKITHTRLDVNEILVGPTTGE